MHSQPTSRDQRRTTVNRPTITLLLWTAIAGVARGQTHETARFEQQENMIRVTADAPRPVEAALVAVRDRFGLPICVEDPILAFADDLRDASIENAGLRKGTLVPRGHPLEISFPTPGGPAEKNADAILAALLNSVNEQLPVKYRVDREPDRFTFVPTQRRDALGKLVNVRPLLDLDVSIANGTRSIAETAQLVSGELSKKTGMTISCCQSFVAGIPWGMGEIAFGTPGMPAREVLKLLIQKAGGRRLWVSRCDLRFCFIDLY